MKISLDTEAVYASSYWGRHFLQEIKAECAKKHTALISLEERSQKDPVIVVGSSLEWLREKVKVYQGQPFILLNSGIDILKGMASTVSFDYADALKRAKELYRNSRLDHAGLFEVNPKSANDLYMKQIFLELFGADSFIAEFSGDVEQDCQYFWDHREEIDSVICPNFIYADILMRFLREKHTQIPIIFFGPSDHTPYPASMNFPMDFHLLVNQAFHVLSLLVKEPRISNINLTLKLSRNGIGKVHLSSSSSKAVTSWEEPFYQDPVILKTMSWKESLDLCDDLDREILLALTKGESYLQISSHLYISESTVKYRISQMLPLFRVPSRTALVKLAKENGYG